MRRFFVWMAAGVLAGSAVPTALDAQGYGIYEHGTCTMARAGTGTASPCADGSAIFFNPAGILGSGRGTLSAGVTYIGPKGSFTNDTSGVATVLEDLKFYIPHLSYARDLGNGFARLFRGGGFDFARVVDDLDLEEASAGRPLDEAPRRRYQRIEQGPPNPARPRPTQTAEERRSSVANRRRTKPS